MTGKMICLGGSALAVPAKSPRSRTVRMLRDVVRWPLGIRFRFASEGPDPSKGLGTVKPGCPWKGLKARAVCSRP